MKKYSAFKPAILITFQAFSCALSFDDMPTMDPSIFTISPHSTSNSTSDSCVGQCAFGFVDRMSAQLGSEQSAGLLNLNYNDFLSAFSNASFFAEFCNLYHEFNYCYTSCPHGYMQELLLRSAEIVDQFCVYNYKAIMAKFGCLSKLDREVSKKCLKTCTRHHDAVTSMMQNFKHLALNGDSTEAENYLAQSCEYVICTLHCDVPAIATLCDFETAELVINLTKKSFDAMQKMALDTGAISKWPLMCADIRTYQLPKPKNAPKIKSGSGEIAVVKSSETLFSNISLKNATKTATMNSTSDSSRRPFDYLNLLFLLAMALCFTFNKLIS